MSDTKSPDPRKRKSARANMRKEMRSSLLLPAALGLAVLLGGALVVVFSPWPFYVSMTLVIGLLLVAYLLWSTRSSRWGLRLAALLIAVPAIAGLSYGLANGSLSAVLLGAGVTMLLLVMLRAVLTPISFRLANGRFQQGDLEGALELVNKSIDARPTYWESYQLRAMIYLATMNLDHAERDAKQAIQINPQAHPVYNTLGHVYLAQERYADAEEAYGSALDRAPGYALYLYHLGLSEFRQEKYNEAAESFAAATQGTLPTAEYDLQARYYLARCLEAMGENEKAAVAREQMIKFAYGLQPLQASIERQPDYPHLDLVRADVLDIAKRLQDADTAVDM